MGFHLKAQLWNKPASMQVLPAFSLFSGRKHMDAQCGRLSHKFHAYLRL